MRKGVTKVEVELAYRLMLARPAENSEVVDYLVERCSELEDLGHALLVSDEFRARILNDLQPVQVFHQPLDLPWVSVETDVSDEQLASMIQHVEHDWTLLGKREPHWSVIVEEKYKAENLQDHLDEFYSSGQQALSYFKSAVDRARVDYKQLRCCFELGCGVGRLSVWLASEFPKLIAADISAPHLALAAKALQARNLQNVDLHLLSKLEEIRNLPDFDCFISIIVLQHNPPPVIQCLLRAVLGRLLPGGLAYFQLPTYRKGAPFHAESYLNTMRNDGVMEVHVLPQVNLWKLVEEANCLILDVREDGWMASSQFISNSILVKKRC